MATTNLNLELIEATDTIQESMIDKMNSNFEKMDKAYKVLVDGLLERTQTDNIPDAMDAIKYCYITEDATIEPNDIPFGKIAYNADGRIIGTKNPYNGPRVTLVKDTSTNSTIASYVGDWGATVDENGTMIIWARTNTTSYENLTFFAGDIEIGEIGIGWEQGKLGNHNILTLFACTINGLIQYEKIEVTLEPYGLNGTNYAVNCRVHIKELTE